MLEETGSPIGTLSVGQQPDKIQAGSTLERQTTQFLDPHPLCKSSGVDGIRVVRIPHAKRVKEGIIRSTDFSCTPA